MCPLFLRVGSCRVLVALALLALWPAGSFAQSQQPDFFFGRPKGSIGVRTGWMFAHAGSDIFRFVENELTVKRSDFNAPALVVDVGLGVMSRAEAVIGFDFSRSSIDSEYRRFVENGQPIRQSTRLQQINFTGSLRVPLTTRGREVSANAWIPRRATPYVGAGGGALRYEFLQEGDFVDFADLHIFSDRFRSAGWAPSALVFGGVDIRVWRRLYLTSEARYVWANAQLGRDFSGFDPIDLAGFKMTGGISGTF